MTRVSLLVSSPYGLLGGLLVGCAAGDLAPGAGHATATTESSTSHDARTLDAAAPPGAGAESDTLANRRAALPASLENDPQEVDEGRTTMVGAAGPKHSIRGPDSPGTSGGIGGEQDTSVHLLLAPGPSQPRLDGVQPANVTFGTIEVAGGLPRLVIQRIVRRDTGRLRNCYELGLLKDPSLKGNLVLRFSIAGDGKVSQTGAQGDLPSKDVVACLEQAFGGMLFPEPEGKLVVHVKYPMAFEPPLATP